MHLPLQSVVTPLALPGPVPESQWLAPNHCDLEVHAVAGTGPTAQEEHWEMNRVQQRQNAAIGPEAWRIFSFNSLQMTLKSFSGTTRLRLHPEKQSRFGCGIQSHRAYRHVVLFPKLDPEEQTLYVPCVGILYMIHLLKSASLEQKG